MGNMEQGSLRCDCNVSVRPVGSTTLGKKVEIKNMNSVRNVRRAIEGEIKRQVEELEASREIVSETRSFNEKTGGSVGMRTKEEVNDYRYFPEPDLSPVRISDQWLEEIRSAMPVLPKELKIQLQEQYSLSSDDALFLTDSIEMHSYFNQAVANSRQPAGVLNWLKGPIRSLLKENNVTIDQLNLSANHLGSLADLTADKIKFFHRSSEIIATVITGARKQS